MRPTVIGREYAVASGHYLATLIASRILDAGGNAVDAGVAASMALAVLQPDVVSFAGVAPTLIYSAEQGQVMSLAGLGHWPAATDLSRLVAQGGTGVPEGILRTLVPAAPATHIEALRRYGSISFEAAASPALMLAREGFAVYPFLAANLAGAQARYQRWPENARIFLPGGKPPAVGQLFRQEDLGRTLALMIEAERSTRGNRDSKLRSVHDYFYRGPLASVIAAFHAKEGGFLTLDDLAGFEVPLESSISVNYQDYEVHACDVWCQGITLLQTLKMLESVDLRRLGHNSADYVHIVAEALNLAFSDREAYVGDPKFIEVPTDAMLSADYGASQLARIDPEKAFGRMPRPGDPFQLLTGGDRRRIGMPAAVDRSGVPTGAKVGVAPDTIYVAVMDRYGNAYSATLSDTTFDAPVIPSTGLVISSRGGQSRLERAHPSGVQPGKRPRLTPTPALAMRNGTPFLCFGTPGGDVQCQAMLQAFFNITQFGMPVQNAVEAPRFASANFPSSFAPHDYFVGRLCVEANIGESVIAELRQRGHDVEVLPAWPAQNGAVCAVMNSDGLKRAGADPRREAYAIAW